MIKLFTIKFDRSLEKFDDSEFQAYIKDKDVLSVKIIDHPFPNSLKGKGVP
ncbi:HRDC domain protein, partial [Candidatus Magnetomorum sp. HK-1]